MTTTHQTGYALWVCVDCYETHHGVREDHGEELDREPLCLIGEELEVTAGLLWEEHAEDCGNRLAGEWVDECECERQTFSWSPCDGCGSQLGGAREALTYWTD